MTHSSGPRRPRRPRGPRLGLALALAGALALHAHAAAAEEARPASSSAQSGSPKPPITLDFAAHLGASYRLGQAPSFNIIDRSGLAAGGGLVFAPVRAFAVGLDYEHKNLGAERLGAGGIGSASVSRAMHTLWVDLHVYPFRTSSFAAIVDIGAGLAWQRAHATGLVDPSRTGATPSLFVCDASDSANAALRAGLGAEVHLGRGLVFTASASFENARLSGELLDACISGAGATSLLAIRAGFAYRLDVSSLFR